MNDEQVRIVIAVAALTALAGPAAALSALATAAGVLLEAVPLLLAAQAASRVLPRGWLPYVGCGCGAGPSARSLPAAAAAWLAFGPWIAFARLGAAALVARTLGTDDPGEPPSLLADLRALVPAALLCGLGSQLLPLVDLTHVAAAVAEGAALGFAAPCGIGSIAVAATLRIESPAAALAFLCVAGIADARTFSRGRHSCDGRGADAFAYVLVAVACASVAVRGGAELVHPRIALALAGAAVTAALLAFKHRRARNPRVRAAPAIVLAAALGSAPPPAYRASETTMQGLFPGERLSFSGRLVRGAADDAVVRYAIVCCRADASPVAVRLERRAHEAAGAWVRVEGRVFEQNARFVLRVEKEVAIAPPSDPFLYR